MKNELVLKVRNRDDLTYLNQFGTVVFSDDIVDVVIIECTTDKIDELKKHPMVVRVEEASHIGFLL